MTRCWQTTAKKLPNPNLRTNLGGSKKISNQGNDRTIEKVDPIKTPLAQDSDL